MLDLTAKNWRKSEELEMVTFEGATKEDSGNPWKKKRLINLKKLDIRESAYKKTASAILKIKSTRWVPPNQVSFWRNDSTVRKCNHIINSQIKVSWSDSLKTSCCRASSSRQMRQLFNGSTSWATRTICSTWSMEVRPTRWLRSREPPYNNSSIRQLWSSSNSSNRISK